MNLRRAGAVLSLAVVAACTDPAPLDPAGDAPRQSAALAALAVPGAPTGLVARVYSPISTRLFWSAGADSIVYFKVEREVLTADSTLIPWHYAAGWPGYVRVHPDTILDTGWTVRYRVRACNDTGCSNWAWSRPIVVGPPAAPANLVATPLSATRMRVNWRDLSTNEDSFRVHRRRLLADSTWSSPQQVAAPDRNATALTDAGVVAGVTYEYGIQACNPAGCSAETLSPHVVIPAPPAAPTGTAASATSATTAQVTWVDASGDETSFTIARRSRNPDGSLEWTVVGTVPAGTKVYADGGLTPGRTYAYLVKACAGAVCSAWSPGARVTLPGG